MSFLSYRQIKLSTDFYHAPVDDRPLFHAFHFGKLPAFFFMFYRLGNDLNI